MKTSILPITLACLLCAMTSYAQPTPYRASGVRSIELRHDGLDDRRDSRIPACVVCKLDGNEQLTLNFDILDADQESLYYSFSHYDADWQPSELMEMEFVQGLNKVYAAERAQLSFNTTMPYIHYSMTIDTSPLTASGNYMVEIHDATDDHLILSEPLWLTEDKCGLSVNVDKGEADQHVSLAIRWPNHGLTRPETELHVSVWQNKRLDDIRHAEAPTFVRPDDITYQQLPEFSFCGGREWRWLDTRSIRLLGISDSKIDFIGDIYHYEMAPDRPDRAYSYREDFNGGQWIESRDRRDDDPDIVADYAMAHFSFTPDDPSLLQSHDFFVIGDATGWLPTPANKLTPNGQQLIGQQLVKQGLHNYLYVARPKSARHDAPQMTDSEGCYGLTENDYHIAIYARRPGDTYDHLIAFKTHNTLRNLNDFIE